MRRLLLISLLAALAPGANAQRTVTASPRFASQFPRAGHPRSFFYPLAFSDPFYSDYLSSTGYPVASQPPVVIVQSPPPEAPVSNVPSPAQPLMFELRGDRYVRVSGPEMSGAEMISPRVIDQAPIDQMPNSPPLAQRPSTTAIRAVARPELPPVVLVFRDGHREKASDYTIADGVLYARGDYYTDGSWNRKIELSALDVALTLQANSDRGVKFVLPSSPNEVIIRP